MINIFWNTYPGNTNEYIPYVEYVFIGNTLLHHRIYWPLTLKVTIFNFRGQQLDVCYDGSVESSLKRLWLLKLSL